MADKKPEEKTYGLKDIELRVMANINSRRDAEMLDFLAFLSMERLALEVTENTQFRVEDGKLFVSEREAPVEVAEA